MNDNKIMNDNNIVNLFKNTKQQYWTVGKNDNIMWILQPHKSKNR